MKKAIYLENIEKKLGNHEILKGISLTVESSDIFGYLGPNGAGKTTSIRIILGLLKADSGTLTILGDDINHKETRMKIGFLLDPDGLYNNMSAEENLQFYAKIYGVKDAGSRIKSLLSSVDLLDRASDKVAAFSKGMRQRLALARAMVHNPQILILDEPTSGLDPTGQLEVRQIMLDLVKKEGKTVFLSSHNLDEVQKICNRIAIIDRGEIKITGTIENLKQKMGKSEFLIKTTGDINETVLTELQKEPEFGFLERKGKMLVFTPSKGTDISDIISILAGRGVKIEEATKKELSLEEMYSTILKEVEVNE